MACYINQYLIEDRIHFKVTATDGDKDRPENIVYFRDNNFTEEVVAMPSFLAEMLSSANAFCSSLKMTKVLGAPSETSEATMFSPQRRCLALLGVTGKHAHSEPYKKS